MSPLIVMALESESGGLIESLGHPVCYTGVGKVNAAYELTRRFHGEKPSLVLNVGSAGSSVFKKGSLAAASRFIQRDMDATGLGFRHGETPFDTHPVILEFDPVFHQLPHGLCGSGDSFLQGPPPVACDIIDMEAYALARVCYRENIPFACVKYITDGADGASNKDWRENLQYAAQAFVDILSQTPLGDRI